MDDAQIGYWIRILTEESGTILRIETARNGMWTKVELFDSDQEDAMKLILSESGPMLADALREVIVRSVQEYNRLRRQEND